MAYKRTITLVERGVRSGIGALDRTGGAFSNVNTPGYTPAPTPAPPTTAITTAPNADITAATAAAAANAGDHTLLYLGVAAAGVVGYIVYRRRKRKS